MLPRAARIRTAPVFGAVRRDGRSANSPLLGVGARIRVDTPLDPARFGFVVSRRVGKAVVRNLVKRRMRAIAQSIGDAFTGWDIVVTARPPAAAATFADLSLAMATAIRRATHLAASPSSDRAR